MEKKNLDWANIGFSYMPTDMRYVSNYKDGAWDEGTLTADSMLLLTSAQVSYSTARNVSRA